MADNKEAARYDLSPSVEVVIVETKEMDGEWVKFSDHAAALSELRTELEASRLECEKMRALLIQVRDSWPNIPDLSAGSGLLAHDIALFTMDLQEQQASPQASEAYTRELEECFRMYAELLSDETPDAFIERLRRRFNKPALSGLDSSDTTSKTTLGLAALQHLWRQT